MIECDLNPPTVGLNADPVLYGVAAGLAMLFPPNAAHAYDTGDTGSPVASDPDRTAHDPE